MAKRVSLRDVARYCNVSASTVSCVVRQVDCVKEETRQRIEAAIEKLGYTIDPALRTLAAYRTRLAKENRVEYLSTIAFFDSEPSEYSRAIFEECHREGKRLGYGINYFRFPRSYEEQARFSKTLWAQGIRGIILGPSQRKFDLQGFGVERFAFVGIGAFEHSPAVDTVTADYFQGLSLAARKCHEEGYRRIGFVMVSHLEARTEHRWLGAYLAFCMQHEQEPLAWIFDQGKTPDGRVVKKWLKGNRIDAILTLAETIPLKASVEDLHQVYLNDWHVSGDRNYISTPRHLVAQKSLSRLNDNLIHQRYGVPEWPIQILIRPVYHEAGVKDVSQYEKEAFDEAAPTGC